MDENQQKDPIALPEATQASQIPSPREELRKEEMMHGRLPSMRINNTRLQLVHTKFEQVWRDVERQKLNPMCPPEMLKVDQKTVFHNMNQDSTFLIAAMLKFLDDCYLEAVEQMPNLADGQPPVSAPASATPSEESLPPQSPTQGAQA